MAQTKRQIMEILSAHGIRPLKRYGQHFLIDGNLMGKLVAAAELGPDDTVLEVGPGTGSLTAELLAVCGAVVAVEIDRTLQAVCRQVCGDSDRLTVIHGDVLAGKSRIAPHVRETLERVHHRQGGRLMLVANLPYQVATPLVVELLRSMPAMGRLCFTVQAEVGERLTADPGSKDYGPASVLVQTLATVQRVARVPPEAFWPAPKVQSVMLRVDRREPPLIDSQTQATLVGLVQHCFGHRRKTMLSNLRTYLSGAELEALIATGGGGWEDRPEQWSVSMWIELARWLAKNRSSPSTAG